MLEIMFPEKNGIDYSLLKLTPEGEYSITRRIDGKRILKRISFLVGNTYDKHITDLTGNVGGDTILFGMNFLTVNSIEYNQENFDALKHNVATYELDNVRLHFGDSTQIYNWQTDILYIDAPWGGPNYKEKEELDLYLGTERVDSFVNYVLDQIWKPKYIFLKVPRNYNFKRFENMKNVKYHNSLIRSFNLISLEVVESCCASESFS